MLADRVEAVKNFVRIDFHLGRREWFEKETRKHWSGVTSHFQVTFKFGKVVHMKMAAACIGRS